MDALPASCHCSFEPATLYMTAGDEKIAASQRDRGGREHIQQVGKFWSVANIDIRSIDCSETISAV
jgi:hypothetical protein